MFHSSGLCRKAIMLPRQTINVFLSWFLLHRVTWGVLVENLCPPESLESASLHPGVLNTLCLLMWSGLKCVQSLWLWECKKKKRKEMSACFCFCFMSGLLRVYTYLYKIIYTTSLSGCVPICFHVYLSFLQRDTFLFMYPLVRLLVRARIHECTAGI